MNIPVFDYLGDTAVQRQITESQDAFDSAGCVIFPNVLDEQMLQRLRSALQPHFDSDIRGRNDFEGIESNRVYALLAKGRVFSELATHPLALAYAQAQFGESVLLSAMLAIRLLPGESCQPWHTDDGHIDIGVPRNAFGISAFWNLDDTTEANGATEILLGSHKSEWRYDDLNGAPILDDLSSRTGLDRGVRADAIKATMPAGSLMLAKGNLWHRGGANNSAASRTIITPQYCPGWARQLENQLLAIPKDIVRQLPVRVQQLIGYSIHPPFMGYVNGVHPNKTL